MCYAPMHKQALLLLKPSLSVNNVAFIYPTTVALSLIRDRYSPRLYTVETHFMLLAAIRYSSVSSSI